jgi:aminopeptidase N
LAHHWWGNYVTVADWKDIWLNEGFATYSEALYYESLYGENHLSFYMEHLAQNYYDEVSRRGHFTVYNPSYLWGATVYQKGAWILHMLRRMIGDEAFMRTLRTYASRHAYGSALTADFISVADEESGHSLSWYFDQWLHQPGFPDLDISWNFIVAEDGTFDITINIEQRQWRNFKFSFPLMIEIKTKSAAFADTLWLADRLNHFRLQTLEKPLELVIDPLHSLLKQYDIVASPSTAALLPDAFALVQNYPNPFRNGEQTTIVFQTPERNAPHFVDVSIYNVLGQKVVNLVHQSIAFGIQTLSWDGIDDNGVPLPPGLYFIRLAAESTIINKKILFVH